MAQITPFKFEKHDKYYFDTYYFHCIDCGAEFTRHRWDNRTKPYCSICTRKHETMKAKERAIRKEQAIRAKAYERFALKLLTDIETIPAQNADGYSADLLTFDYLSNMVWKTVEQLKEE